MPPVNSERIERRAFLTALLIILVAFTWFVLRPLLAPLVLATLTATLAFPFHRRIERRLKGRKILAATVSTVLLTITVLGPAIGLTVLFLVEVQEVIADLLGEEAARSRLAGLAQQYLDWASQLVQSITGQPIDLENLGREALRKLATGLYERLPGFFNGAGRLAIGAVLLYVVLFSLLVRGPRLLDRLVLLLPIGRERSLRILSRIEETTKGVFLGSIATALVQGAVAALCFWVLGFENQLIWGMLTAGAGLLPVVGTALIWGPIALYLLATGHEGSALAMLVMGIVISTIDNLIKPLLITGQSEVPPVLVFIGIFGGLRSMGGMGLLYGPLLVACTTEMVRIYRDDFQLRQKEPLRDRDGLAATAAADGDHPGGGKVEGEQDQGTG